MKKVLLFMILMFPFVVNAKELIKYEDYNLISEEKYEVNKSGSFDVYFKDDSGHWVYFDNLKFGKSVTSKRFYLKKDIYGIKLVKTSGYEVNLDCVSLEGKTDIKFLRKLNSRDNDLIEVVDELILDIKGKGVLEISARTPKGLLGKDYAFQFPTYSSDIDFIEYKLDSNYGSFSDKEFIIPDEKYNVYSNEYVESGSGHPNAPFDYYVVNDENYLYVLTEAFGDNTFDHGKDYSKVIVNDGKNTKSYQVNTVEDNKYGRYWFKYTDNKYGIKWQHMQYIIKVPLADFENKDYLKLAFEYYGTDCGLDEIRNVSFEYVDKNGKNIAGAKFELSFDIKNHFLYNNTTYFQFIFGYFGYINLICKYYNDGNECLYLYKKVFETTDNGANFYIFDEPDGSVIYSFGGESINMSHLVDSYENYPYSNFINFINSENKDYVFKLKLIEAPEGYKIDDTVYNVVLKYVNSSIGDNYTSCSPYSIHHNFKFLLKENDGSLHDFKLVANEIDKTVQIVPDDKEPVQEPEDEDEPLENPETGLSSSNLALLVFGSSIIVLLLIISKLKVKRI